ncbi:unnamed protein product [Cylindrotheca closterium]|uniref:Uncharacterized protein n=1 Tax=Cylindrotheca closterium TaxID=2856 RepID=A0AAD2CPE8_9STRA|nr:unnamed protein product [Cylindrotheca closterium]
MAEPAILRQLFVRIRLTQAVADTMVDDHNINSTATLTKIKPDTVSKLVKTLRHPGGGGNGHVIPFQVQQGMAPQTPRPHLSRSSYSDHWPPCPN